MNGFQFNSHEQKEHTVEEVLEAVQVKVDTMIRQMGEKSPLASVSGIYDDVRVDRWTSGFWPGILWILYDITGKEHYKEAAWNWDEKIEQCFVSSNIFHHDVGFQFMPTAVLKYKITGDEDGRRRGLFAANFLAGRFNPVGNFIRAWNQDRAGWSIIDTCMNLSILFWASEEIQDPRFRHIAKAHADTVLRHFIREDGSARHIVVFNPENGEFVEAKNGQGYAPESAWSRGQSWALHGMANAYRYTGEIRYLKAAQRVAHYFLSALPDDSVPYWDFRLPSFEGEPRDSSAAACAASGLLEIADLVAPEEAGLYRSWAEKTLRSLTSNYGTWDKPEYEGLLLGATGSKPSNSHVNVSLIFGDYFYVEALAKLNGWKRKVF